MKRQSIFKTLALTLVGFRCLVQTGEIQGQAISVPAGISYTTFPSGFDYKVAFGDFNGDGKTDLAARNCQTGDVLIYYSNGTSFSSSPDQMVQIAVPDCANWDLHAADINGDGYADLINRSRVGGELYVHYNTGNGFNTVGGGFGVTPTPSNWKSMFADINGDRRADLVNLNLDTGDTYIHFNNQQGFGMVADRLIPGLGVPATYNPDWSQTLADLNGDGLAEFVNVQKAQGYFYGHNNQGSTFETTSTLILQGPSPTSFADLYLADLTGDGLADVVLLRGNTQIYVYTTSKNAKGELVAVVGSSPPTDSPCQTPTVGAGMGQAITLPAQASLAGSSSAATVTWSKVDGPGSVSFSNASSLYTTASFSVAGNYILKLTARDGACESEATVSVTVNSAPTKANAAPYVNAGPDQTILFPKSAALSGVATDDGLPKNVLIYKWSKVSGPGRVTFQNTSALKLPFPSPPPEPYAQADRFRHTTDQLRRHSHSCSSERGAVRERGARSNRRGCLSGNNLERNRF
ncbi:MAG: FG-GAP-like repeat-containing protein [Verrucomicrobiota bacterium]